MAALTSGNILTVSDRRDETQGLASEISPVDGSTVQSLSLPYATRGDILPSGIFCLAVEGETDLESFSIYDRTGVLIAAVTSIVESPVLDWICPVYAWGDHTFYVLAVQSGVGDPTLYTISDAGAVGGTTWALPHDADEAPFIAVSPDGSILYYTDIDAVEIHRYDLVNDTPLSDLIGSFTYIWGDGLFVRANGDIVAMGIDDDGLDNVVLISPEGSVIAAYPFDEDVAEVGEIFTDPDPDYIWIRSFPDDTGDTSTFKKVELATGTAVVSFTVDTLEGTGDVPQTCPNLVLRDGAVSSPDGVIGPYLVWRMGYRVP